MDFHKRWLTVGLNGWRFFPLFEERVVCPTLLAVFGNEGNVPARVGLPSYSDRLVG
jgi:hypothetical protein